MAPRLNLPPLTRALFFTTLLFSALNAALRFRKWSALLDSVSTSQLASTAANYFTNPKWAIPYLVLVPTQSVRYPWTFLTASLVENNVVSLVVSAAVVWFGGRYLERAWGSTEFGKFTLFVTMIPNLFAFAVYGLWYGVAMGMPEYPQQIQGLVALEAGFLVALKQLVPEHTVSLFKGALRVRIKHFPALFTLANIISGPLLGTDTALWLSLVGFLTSWIYLRFFRLSEITSATTGESSKMKGDASDLFSFVAFFPDVMHPVLSPVSDGIYAILVKLKVLTPFSDEAIEVGNESAVSRSESLPSIMTDRGGAGGSGRRAEAERRRALALRALDQRLNAAAANRAGGAPVTNAAPDISGDTPGEAIAAVSVEAAEPVKEAQA